MFLRASLVLGIPLKNIYCGKTYYEALADSRLWGRLFDSAIGAHIINGAMIGHHSTCYWRDEKGREVDYVLAKSGKAFAEVATIHPKDFEEMEYFRV